MLYEPEQLPVKPLFIRGYYILRDNMFQLFTISAVFHLLQLVVSQRYIAPFLNSFQMSAGASSYVGSETVAAFLVVIFLALLFPILISQILYNRFSGFQTGFLSLFRQILPVLSSALGVGLVTLLICSFGFQLLIVPGIYLYILLGFGVYVAVVEKQGVFSSLKKSLILIQGKMTFLLAVYLLLGLLYIASVFIPWAIVKAGAEAAGIPSLVPLTFTIFLVNSVVQPYSIIIVFLMYLGLRREKEQDFSLERAQEL